MAKPVKLPKSAITGKIVSPKYAQTHPKTTVVMTVKKGK